MGADPVGDGGPPLDRLYDEAACGLLVTSPEGLILRVNRTFCAWVGRDAVELVGARRVQELLTMGGRIFHQTHWIPLMQIQGSVSELKLELVHRDGLRFPTVWNGLRREADGRTWHELAVFVAEDRHKYEHELLLSRRRAEELLAKERATQQALLDAQGERDRQRAVAEDRALFAEQMVAIVSHDLRNPLSVIAMSARLLGLGGLAPAQHDALVRLVRSNDRARRLIDDLLDFSQARLGTGLQLEIEPIDLHALVADAVEDLRLAHPARAIEHRHEGAGPCSASPDRLTQIVGNLVVNALTHGAQDQPVRVASSIGETGFSIAVHNGGEPIDEALLPGLFDPMTRGVSPSEHASGIGLGLFIVDQIVRAHGGRIELESARDRGTTFTVHVPGVGPPGGGDREGDANDTRASG